MSVVSALVALTVTIVPIDSGLLTSTPITINNQPGLQQDPHLHGDLACYSNEEADALGNVVQEVRYYDFATGQDLAISNVLPGGRASDLLCDVDQGRVVFTRLFNRATIMRFDTASQTFTDLFPTGTFSMGSSIGAQTVALVDFQYGTGELLAVDLTSSVASRLTNDQISDANPEVAPAGDLIVWERCSNANCDIYRALWTGGAWGIQALTSHVATERSAATDGSLVAFQRENPLGPTGTDIVVLTGSGEMSLEIPGEQYNPAISNGLIVFEHRSGGIADLYLYETAGNRLFQITNTQAVNESLSDIFVLPNGQVRIIWEADTEDPITFERDADIYAVTLTIPPVQCSWFCYEPSANGCTPCRTLWDGFDWDSAPWM